MRLAFPRRLVLQLVRQQPPHAAAAACVYSLSLTYCCPRFDPLDAANASFIDNGYPHTHMRPQLVRAVLLAHELRHHANVTFWLECGSMLGGSLIRTAQVARRLERQDGLSLVASEWPALSNTGSAGLHAVCRASRHPQIG